MDDEAQNEHRCRRAPVRFYTDFEASNPFRSPAWRWSLAERIVADGRRLPSTLGDEWLRHAVRFLRNRSSQRLVGAMAAVAGAVELWKGDVRRRHIIEAWLLTGSDDDEIAERVALSPAVVGAYEGLFFSVRSHLRATSWILQKAIRLPKENDTTGMVDVGPYWKLFAFCGGRLILASLLEAVPTMDAAYDFSSLDLRNAADREIASARLCVAILAAKDLRLTAELSRFLGVIARFRREDEAKQRVREALTTSASSITSCSSPPVQLASSDRDTQAAVIGSEMAVGVA